jgi:hypothetical protein
MHVYRTILQRQKKEKANFMATDRVKKHFIPNTHFYIPTAHFYSCYGLNVYVSLKFLCGYLTSKVMALRGRAFGE